MTDTSAPTSLTPNTTPGTTLPPISPTAPTQQSKAEQSTEGDGVAQEGKSNNGVGVESTPSPQSTSEDINITAIPPFACRKCQVALEIDSSFVELKEQGSESGSGSGSEAQFLIDAGINLDDGVLKSIRDQARAQMGTSDEDVAGASTAVSLCLAADYELNLDYPLCEECSTYMIKELEEKLDTAERELETYKDHLEEINQSNPLVVPEAEFEQEMAKSLEEERRLCEELNKIEQSREALTRDMKVLAMENKELEAVEAKYWQDFNDYQALLSDCEEQRDAVCSRIDRLNSQLDKLKRTNVYNDAFHIWHDGHFGTICNLRLGRLPSVKVPFEEINAAWGQAVLLLYSIAKKCKFTFSTYRLIPMGSYSKMARISDDNAYELYTTGPVLGFWSRRYDQAMTWFLQCVQEFGEWVVRQDPTFKMPYWIKDDTINGMCIKIQMNKEEEWTKALKYMLTNLKWMLAWVARREDSSVYAAVRPHAEAK